MDFATLVTFPKGTLWRSGVSLQNITSITTHLHLYIGRDRATLDRSSVDFSRLKSSVDNLPLLTCHWAQSGRLSTLILQAGDFPPSHVRKTSLGQDAALISHIPQTICPSGLANRACRRFYAAPRVYWMSSILGCTKYRLQLQNRSQLVRMRNIEPGTYGPL